MRQRVAWTPGTTAQPGPPRPRPPGISRQAWIARKREDVSLELRKLEAGLRVRSTTEALSRQRFEQSRAVFLDWCAEANDAALARKRLELVDRLGPETVMALQLGALRREDVSLAVANDLAALSILDRVLPLTRTR